VIHYHCGVRFFAGQLRAVLPDATVDLGALVMTTEDPVQREHNAWLQQMTRTVATSGNSRAGDIEILQ
jgi:hypothetical protein